MRYQLIKPINPEYSTIEQILTNRGIPREEVYHYLNTTDDDISSPLELGEKSLNAAAQTIIQHIFSKDKTLVICDCDCDGFTSAALLINYLYDLFPTYVETGLKWFVHEDKQHGLEDVMDYINQKDFKLVICPDASSNDYEYHKQLKAKGIDVIVLDHHLADATSEDAIVINNQLCGYENKELSGVGVVYQFCRFIDSKMQSNFADNYLDLVALGLTGDMMSLTSIETKHLINKGFEPENIKNPYIYEMWQKNHFKLGDHITSIDAAFYIVPMVNAVQRSGTIEEKELLFKSMLKYEAFAEIASTKRGCKGQTERLVDQAVRMSTNVKNRQTRAQDASMEYLENRIVKENMMDRKVLLFTLEPGKVDKNIAGLIANKISAKYQRPSCMLTKVGDVYQGSARGYEMSGVTNFKDICDATGCVNWTAGHQNAFGVSINVDKIDEFLEKTDAALANMTSEPVYYVDYIYNGADVNPQDILAISDLSNLWGKDLDEAMVAVKDIKISKDLVTVYRKTSNTLKITLPNKVSLMKFNATDEECEMLENQTGAYIQMEIVGKCHKNEWMGNVSPQIFIEDWEITGQGKYLF
jgi:single-stranded-DNA-specific exonuclease